MPEKLILHSPPHIISLNLGYRRLESKAVKGGTRSRIKDSTFHAFGLTATKTENERLWAVSEDLTRLNIKSKQ